MYAVKNRCAQARLEGGPRVRSPTPKMFSNVEQNFIYKHGSSRCLRLEKFGPPHVFSYGFVGRPLVQGMHKYYSPLQEVHIIFLHSEDSICNN